MDSGGFEISSEQSTNTIQEFLMWDLLPHFWTTKTWDYLFDIFFLEYLFQIVESMFF